ncbi:General alpha-glucoside permease [Exophiala dermatitidis]
MPRSGPSLDIDERSPLIRAVNTARNSDIEGRPLVEEEESSSSPGSEREERFFQGERPPSETIGLNDSTLENKSSWYLILLTLSIGGLQIVWSVELSNGSPYLLSLGMSKALVAFVWLTGPLTGTLVQPYIGIRSDRCRISWGKRKPFMIAGTLGTVASSMTLAYARDIIRVIGRLGVDAPYEGGYQTATIILATIMMWCLDFSINTVQAAIRAFIVDNAPSHQQESANAWASRMTGVGNVLGYVFGYLNLPRYFHFFGNTQFKVLVVIASIALSSTVLVSALAIKERNPQLEAPSRVDESGGLLAFFKQVFVSIKRLPPQIRQVCEIQFFHWMGWFPFLFYITTYIGQLYVDPYLKPGLSDDEVEKLWGKATRIGTFALLIYAITSFVSNIILPFLVVPTYKSQPVEEVEDFDRPIAPPSSRPGMRPRSYSWGDNPYSGSQSTLTFPQSPEEARVRRALGQDHPGSIQKFLTKLQIPGLTLRRAWLLSQLLFSLCTFSTIFITTPLAATIMTALVGISWSLTLWAPFALISAEISKRDELRRKKQRQRLINGDDDSGDDMKEEEEDQAGIILGLHNVAISAPQILATLVSSVVFKFLQKPRNEPGDVSVGWTLRIGGMATLIAALITWRMKEPGSEEDAE